MGRYVYTLHRHGDVIYRYDEKTKTCTGVRNDYFGRYEGDSIKYATHLGESYLDEFNTLDNPIEVLYG